MVVFKICLILLNKSEKTPFLRELERSVSDRRWVFEDFIQRYSSLYQDTFTDSFELRFLQWGAREQPLFQLLKYTYLNCTYQSTIGSSPEVILEQFNYISRSFFILVVKWPSISWLTASSKIANISASWLLLSDLN